MFDETYSGNPLVNVFCLGIAQHDALVKGNASGVGNPIYYVGAKTGRDGIHGATMASAEFDDRSAEKRPAVQVGDPFMEKLLLEACLEVMATDACVGVQDMGAAGLTCATSETGSRGGVGVEIDVAHVPQRETGHDAVRDHAVRIAGAHAAHRQARPRSGSRAHLREVGPARRGDRRGDGRRPAAADQAQRRGRGRRAESRADRRGAGLSTGRSAEPAGRDELQQIPRASLKPAPAPADAFADAARVAHGRQQALDLPAVRPHGAHQHDRAGRRGRRRRARQGHRPRAGDVGGRQRPIRRCSIRGRARGWRWPKRRATSRAPAPCRSARPTA